MGDAADAARRSERAPWRRGRKLRPGPGRARPRQGGGRSSRPRHREESHGRPGSVGRHRARARKDHRRDPHRSARRPDSVRRFHGPRCPGAHDRWGAGHSRPPSAVTTDQPPADPAPTPRPRSSAPPSPPLSTTSAPPPRRRVALDSVLSLPMGEMTGADLLTTSPSTALSTAGTLRPLPASPSTRPRTRGRRARLRPRDHHPRLATARAVQLARRPASRRHRLLELVAFTGRRP